MEHVRIDVTGASEGGFSLMGVFNVLYKLLIVALLGALASIPGVLSKQVQYALAAYGIAFIVWVWWAFFWPRRAQASVRAYDSSLDQIRSALKKARAGSYRFRHLWFGLNLALALCVAAIGFALIDGRYAGAAALVAVVFALNGVRLWSDRSGFVKTMFAWALIVAIWWALLTAWGLIFGDRQGENGFIPWLASIAAIGAAIWLSRRVAPLSQATMAEMRTRDGRAPVLFLRSFNDEAEPILESGGPKFEAVLASAARPYGPFIAIGRPGELRPSGAARVYLADDAWQDAVLALMDEAAFIVALPGLTPGLDWEMQRITERGRLRKTIFVMPPRNRQARIARLRTLLAETPEGARLHEIDLAPAMALHLTRDWRWAVLCSEFISFAEYQAAFDVAVYGVLLTRE